jgi:hypothetical protein
MAKNYGTYRNQYGKLVTDRGPSEGQTNLLDKLVAEKVVTDDYTQSLIDAFGQDELSGQNARVLIDNLLAAKSVIIPPSVLGPQEPGKMASPKQLEWVQKLLIEKAVDDVDATAVQAFLDEGLTGRHAGRILDFLFERPAIGAPAPAEGFVGEVGEKISVSGELVVFKKIPSKFGETNLIVVRTAGGQEIKAFSNAKSFWGLSQGQHITIEGEVRSHDTYKGSETTMLKAPKAVAVGDGEGLLGQTITEEPAAVAAAPKKAEKAEDLLDFWGLNN